MFPSVSLVLHQSPETVPLRRAAQSFVQNLAARYNPAASQYDVATARVIQTTTGAYPAILQKYCFLAFRIEVSVSSKNQPMTVYWPKWISIFTMSNRVCMMRHHCSSGDREAVYPKLAPVAMDLVSAPASQALVEPIFPVCGLLSSGLRNRTTTSLEQCVFLKINKKLLLDLVFLNC